MKRLMLKIAWWIDDICHALIEWADPIGDESVREIVNSLKGGAQ